jgi:hypothetical protein
VESRGRKQEEKVQGELLGKRKRIMGSGKGIREVIQ